MYLINKNNNNFEYRAYTKRKSHNRQKLDCHKGRARGLFFLVIITLPMRKRRPEQTII